ncbi:MAG: type II toxin-antitoxin system VapC family toxin [Candidatus Andersenbacteria bacterium]
MQKIAFDSSILIYYTAANPVFGPAARELLEMITAGQHVGVISVIAVTELLTIKKKAARHSNKEMKRLERWLFSLSDIVIIPIDIDIAMEGAAIRQQYGFKTPDALHLATAKIAGAKAFYTTDKQLVKYKGIKVKLLQPT